MPRRAKVAWHVATQGSPYSKNKFNKDEGGNCNLSIEKLVNQTKFLFSLVSAGVARIR